MEPADPLNSVLDRFMHGMPRTEADRSLFKKRPRKNNPADDRIRRIARALLALTAAHEKLGILHVKAFSQGRT